MTELPYATANQGQRTKKRESPDVNCGKQTPPKAESNVSKRHTGTEAFRRLRFQFVWFIRDDRCVYHINEGERRKEVERKKEKWKTYRRMK